MGATAYRKPPDRSIARAIAFCLIASLTVWAGCASREFDRLMRSWQGHTADDLFRTWGPPNFLFPEAGGGMVAVYVPGQGRQRLENERVRIVPGTPVYEPAMSRAWPVYRAFFIATPTNRVARTEWRGEWECCGE